MIGVKDLIESLGIKKSKLRNEMEKAEIPFSYSNHETFYNLVNGKTRPRDPIVYVYLSQALNTPLEEILMRYSDVGEVEVKTVKKQVTKEVIVKVKAPKKENW